jgi:hypothetical protein
MIASKRSTRIYVCSFIYPQVFQVFEAQPDEDPDRVFDLLLGRKVSMMLVKVRGVFFIRFITLYKRKLK